MIASTLNFLNFCGLSNIIFIHLSGEKSQFKENHNNVDAKFKVQIPQGNTGTTRVCVKSFSMPNSYHNIYGDMKTVKFVEWYRPTSGGDWVYEEFSFNLAEGYTETDNLFSE